MCKRRIRRTLITFLAAMAFATAGVASAQEAPPAAENQPVVHSWALSPGDGSQAGDRTNMVYELAPGAETTDAVTLFNYSTVKLVFTVYATDAFNNGDGEFDLLAGDETPTDLGTWVEIPQREIAVGAGQQVTFPITIRVPKDAAPGDHAGAILASSTALGSAPDGKVVNLDRRTGSRIYVRIDGRLAPGLAVTGVRTSYTPSLNPFSGRAEVTYQVENTGNVRLTGTQRASVGGPLGLLRRTAEPLELSELLPGERVTVTRSFTGVAATLLAMAEVDVDPAPAGGVTDLEVPARRSFAFALPISLLALGVVIVLGRVALRSYRRHRRELVAVEVPQA